MGRESSMRPEYTILAYITSVKERILASNCLSLLAENEQDAADMTKDIAKAMKADVVQLTNGDYMVIRV
ncbi:hypothetical protein JNUCC1_00166 [Lentibacillus sp. JNUCC-1]|uniref:capping complex subunit for YIEGIA n=1 Tax=Lentibacillus sp. JNUCC-1 TaxID=2654513 RepID=UPI0012E74797|nr:hypothetical protein [Lentibacillus sp. JNUCC-1]MUV36364.1 hypothetical protein [Lentibacillus sp. JNUCC-1]